MSDYDSKIIRKQIRVYGSVQGVGFRYRTEHAAESRWRNRLGEK